MFFCVLPKDAVNLLHFKTLGVDLVYGRLVVDRLSIKIKLGEIEQQGRRHCHPLVKWRAKLQENISVLNYEETVFSPRTVVFRCSRCKVYVMDLNSRTLLRTS